MAGSKEILVEFSQRKQSHAKYYVIGGSPNLNEGASSLIDDSYYAYVKHKKDSTKKKKSKKVSDSVWGAIEDDDGDGKRTNVPSSRENGGDSPNRFA